MISIGLIELAQRFVRWIEIQSQAVALKASARAPRTPRSLSAWVLPLFPQCSYASLVLGLYVLLTHEACADIYFQYSGPPFATIDAGTLENPDITNITAVIRVQPYKIEPYTVFTHTTSQQYYDGTSNKHMSEVRPYGSSKAAFVPDVQVVSATISDGVRQFGSDQYDFSFTLFFDSKGQIDQWIVTAKSNDYDPLHSEITKSIRTQSIDTHRGTYVSFDSTHDYVGIHRSPTTGLVVPAESYTISTSGAGRKGQWSIIESSGSPPAPPANAAVAKLLRSVANVSELQVKLKDVEISSEDMADCQHQQTAANADIPKKESSASSPLSSAVANVMDFKAKLTSALDRVHAQQTAPAPAPTPDLPPHAVFDECVVDKKIAARASASTTQVAPIAASSSQVKSSIHLPVSPGVHESTFSVGAYEAVAIKTDNTVEVRSFISDKSDTYPEIGNSRIMSDLHDVVSVKAQATYDAIRIGNISAAREKDGAWWGWQPKGSPNRVPFQNNLVALGMTDVDAPPPEKVKQIAGGRGSLWLLYDDGMVLMTSARGLIPNKDLMSWQKTHKFNGVVKVCATAGPSGSFNAMMLRSDGTVWANGAEFPQGWVMKAGTEGEQKVSKLADPRFSAIQVKGLEHVVDLAVYWPSAAVGQGVALLKNGSLVSLKIRRVGEEALSSIQLTPIATPAKALRVAAGGFAVGALDVDGRVWVWGSNPEVMSFDFKPVPGFRGKEISPERADEPMLVDGIEDVVDIDFSSTFAGALKQDGTVWVWSRQAPQKIFDNVKIPH